MSKNELIGLIVSNVLTWLFTHVFHTKKAAAKAAEPSPPKDPS